MEVEKMPQDCHLCEGPLYRGDEVGWTPDGQLAHYQCLVDYVPPTDDNEGR